nr:imidazoleglycerol-phosphate dehydratase HisB [Pigmentibacter ruber]
MRISKKNRTTKETTISINLNIDGSRKINIDTQLKFFDHMLEQLAFHSNWDLDIRATGDIDVDDHHLIEDIAILLGECLNELRLKKKNLMRYGQRLLPMDSTLILCALDLDGRGECVIDLPFSREFIGKIATEMWKHFFKSLSSNGNFSLHIKTLYFDNNHHLVEGSFKSLALSLKEAFTLNNSEKILSTKGEIC